MATSRYFDATDTVVSLLRAAGLTVWDGPVVTGDFSDAVFVGFDGDLATGDSLAAEMNQDWEGIGARSRKEDLRITCAAIGSAGDADIKIARDKAKAVLAVVETTLRANVDLGFPSPSWCGVVPIAAHQESYADGNLVRIVFQIVIRTRI